MANRVKKTTHGALEKREQIVPQSSKPCFTPHQRKGIGQSGGFEDLDWIVCSLEKYSRAYIRLSEAVAAQRSRPYQVSDRQSTNAADAGCKMRNNAADPDGPRQPSRRRAITPSQRNSIGQSGGSEDLDRIGCFLGKLCQSYIRLSEAVAA